MGFRVPKKQPAKFSEFGLDDVKRTKDRGSIGQAYCGWASTIDVNFDSYGHSVDNGFSMCFQNFCICVDCVRDSFLPENAHRWVLDPCMCFKCKKKYVVCYQHFDVEKSGAGLGICKDCMIWAAQTLKVEVL